ncbi:MAG TPA: hypothetical protein VFF79_08630 [Conexibacter sp.]|jgi:hypothetical protein|nr:hypothetical protein [Conexibacter sp.]
MARSKSIVAVACVLMAAVAPAAALARNGAVRQALTANARGDCSIGGAGPQSVGFVILNRADDHVSAVISLRGAPANGRWQVELDQTPLMGCSSFDGFITTNARGDGHAVVSDPFQPGNTGAFVRLDALNDAAQAGGIIASEGTELSR